MSTIQKTKGQQAEEAIDAALAVQPKGAGHLPDYAGEQLTAAKLKPRIEAAMLATHRKDQLFLALDSALDVIAMARNELFAHGPDFTAGDRQKIATTLEQMGRLCWTVAKSCERQKGKS